MNNIRFDDPFFLNFHSKYLECNRVDFSDWIEDSDDLSVMLINVNGDNVGVIVSDCCEIRYKGECYDNLDAAKDFILKEYNWDGVLRSKRTRNLPL